MLSRNHLGRTLLAIAFFTVSACLPVGIAYAQAASANPSSQHTPLDAAQHERDRAAQQGARDRVARDRARNRVPTDAEALAIAALRSLMSVPPERALPLIERTLRLQKSDLVKARALFVLGQISSPAAHALLLKNAQELTGDLQLEAIRSIGIGGDDASIATLPALYAKGSAEVQDAVLRALLIADGKATVLQLALTAKSPAQLDPVLDTLAAMGAVDELRQLGAQGIAGDTLVRDKLVRAFIIAGDFNSLLNLARTDADEDIRSKAIRALGMIGTAPAKAALLDLYQNATTAPEKTAALGGMLIANDQKTVLTLYRNSKSSAEKREVFSTLSKMGGDAALEAIDSALQGQTP